MLTLLLTLSAAQAQDLTAIDADPFEPAAGMLFTNGTVQGESAQLMGEGVSFGLLGHVAGDLLELSYDDGATAPVVSETVGTTLYGGYTYSDLFRVDVYLPIYAYAEAPVAPYRAPAMGDARIKGHIPLFDTGDDLFFLSVAPHFSLPTGTKRALLHRGTHGGLDVNASGEYQGFGYLGNVGITVAPTDNLGNIKLGSTIDLTTGAYYRLNDNFRVGGDYDLHLGLPSGDDAEIMNLWGTIDAFAQTINDNGLTMSVGGGTGINAGRRTLYDDTTGDVMRAGGGIGAPGYRLYLGVGYAPITRDTDKDGYKDDEDSCPLEPEDFDEFEDDDGCPEADNDGDGLIDDIDRCPNEPEDFDDFEDDDGCPELDNDLDDILDPDDECPLEPGVPERNGCPVPPDRDEDGLLDDVDECPDEPGPEKTNGCPDRDDDLVPDYRDRCPDDPRPAEEDPAFSDGCPKRVFYSGKSITITDKVLFASGKARIQSASFPLLDEVADIFKNNNWIQKVEIGGHTDSQGSEEMNQGLSERRAKAVMSYLVGKGVGEHRLTAKGYGEAQPIATNRTPVGRAKNRRVEFNISEQTPPKRERAFDPDKDASRPAPEVRVVPKPAEPEATEPKAAEPETPIDVAPVEPEAAPDPAPERPADEPWDVVTPQDPDLELIDEAFTEPTPPPPPEPAGRRGKKKKKKGKKGNDSSDLPDALDPLRLIDLESIQPVDPTEEPAPWDVPEEPRTGEDEEEGSE